MRQDTQAGWSLRMRLVFVFMLVGIAAMGYRLLFGLGAATGLNDVYPWGFWLGFDVIGGEAMAAGGFVVACAVYVFNWDKYRAIVRPAILTALIGYLMAVIALFLDLGHPWRIWHPAVMWQVRSVLWLVAVLVILYTLVLGFEAAPAFLERFGRQRMLAAVKRLMAAAVIVGVVLSTLHQASLGAVFLIAGAKMSPLWHSRFLPYMFLVSAVAMGIAMVGIETMLSERAFGHRVDPGIYEGLGRGLRNTLLFYLLCGLAILFTGPGPAAAFSGALEGNMYLLEMLLGVILPLALLADRRRLADKERLLLVDTLVVAGVLLNRMNVCLFSMDRYAVFRGGGYFPTLPEFLVSLGLVCLGIVLFRAAARHLPLFAGG